MEHSFNTAVAEYCGIEEAIILNNLNHWIQKNKANGTHFYDGKFWTYNSYPAFTELFPYMAKHSKDENGNPDLSKPRDCQKIKRTIQNLYKAGLIHIGNYNKKGYDRTNWYSLTDLAESLLNGKYDPNCSIKGQNCQSKTTHGGVKNDPWSVENDRPIPYSKQQIENTNKIKLHSPLGFSDENQGGDIDSSFQDNGIEVQNNQPTEPKKTKQVKLPHEKYKLTEAEYRTLQSYHKGFCETIDLHAKVKYNRDFKFMISIYKKLNKNINMLKMLYSYFRTYRDFNKAFILEIRSLASLDKKMESLLAEAIRETKERIMKTNSLILHEIPDKKIIIKYIGKTLNGKDFKLFKEKGDEGYDIILIDFGFTAEEAGYTPYVKPQTNYPI